MKDKLINAVEELDRTICSVNYRGSFTRAFAEVFSNILGAAVILRQHYENHCSMDYLKELHSYKITDEENELFLKELLSKKKIEVNSGANINQIFVKEISYPECDGIADNLKNGGFGSIEIKIESEHIPNIENIIGSLNRGEKEIKSVVSIPIIIRSGEKKIDDKPLYVVCNPFGELEDQCKYNNTKSNCICDHRLISVIYVYSFLTVKDLNEIIGNLSLDENTFLNKILNIFYIQEEPYCYGSPPRLSNHICNLCPVREPCWIGYIKNSTEKLETSGLPITKRMTPDEVVAQLFEKCKEIIDREVDAKVSFLRYRGDLRKFQYRGIHSMDLDANPYENDKDKGKRPIPDEVVKWKKQLQNIKEYADTDISQDLIEESIVKEIYDFQVGAFVAGKEITFSCGAKLTKHKKIKLPEIYSFENEKPVYPRQLLESLAFKNPLFIAMPTYYMGQLLGIIFVNLKPPMKNQGELKFKTSWKIERAYNFKRQFYRISIEFGIMLYHALTYDFISDIIKAYNSTNKSIQETLLLSFNQIFNTCLNVWIPVKSKNLKVNINIKQVITVGFGGLQEEIKILKKPPFSISNILEEKVIDVFSTNKPEIIKLDESSQGFISGFNDNSPYIKSLNDDAKKDCGIIKIGVQSVLLVPIRDKNILVSGLDEGVYLFFFESSKYILQRHSVELLREISGVLNFVSFGEQRQQEILSHARQSAVAAIMGRNMSHNIGSHVLHYHQKNMEQKNTLSKKDVKFNDDIKFMNYLKTRMDFVANITTSDPSWFYNMDLFDDVLKPFIEQRILLNGIVLSEGICRQCDDCKNGKTNYNHALVHFKIIKDGKTFKTKLNGPTYTLTSLKDAFQFEKIYVAIPHSFLGLHALYTILENFIRNCAKHSKYIEFDDKDINSLKNIIEKHQYSDNLDNSIYNKINSEIININNRNDFLCKIKNIIETCVLPTSEAIKSRVISDIVTSVKNDFEKASLNISISINSSDIDMIHMTLSDGQDIDSFKEIDSSLDSKLIDSKNATLNFKGWGFKEQKISANYLRLGRVSCIDNKEYSPPDYYRGGKPLFDRDRSNGQQKICLEFSLLKPKLVYFVVEIPSDFKVTDLEYVGTFCNSDEFIKDINDGIPHEFIVFENEILKNKLIHNVQLLSLPQRILTIENMIKTSTENFNILNITKNKLYKEWLTSIIESRDYSSIPLLVKKTSCIKNICNSILLDDHGDEFFKSSNYLGYLPYRNNSSLSTYLSINKDHINNYELMEVALSKV